MKLKAWDTWNNNKDTKPFRREHKLSWLKYRLIVGILKLLIYLEDVYVCFGCVCVWWGYGRDERAGYSTVMITLLYVR